MKQLILSCFLSQLILTGIVFAQPSVEVSAVNTQGDRLENFEAMLADGERRRTQWYKAKNGKVVFEHYDLRSQSGTVDAYLKSAVAFVRSANHATEFQSFELGENKTRRTLTLEEGRELTIELADEADRLIPPDLEPILLPAPYRDTGGFRWQRPQGSRFRQYADANWFLLQCIEAAKYVVRVTERTPPLYLHIDNNDFLRCYESGPYDLAKHDEDSVEIVLPTPTSISAVFRIPPEAVTDGVPMKSLRYSVSRPKQPGGTSLFPIFFEPVSELDSELHIPNMSPGELHVSIVTTSKTDVAYGETDPGIFRDRQVLNLESGQPQSVNFVYKQFSERPYLGDRQVTLEVNDPFGNAAENKRFRVEYSDIHFGHFVVASGELEDGRIDLQNVLPTTELKHPQRYLLSVDARRIGRFAIDDESDRQVETFVLAPDVGDKANPFTAQNLDGDAVTVDFGGQITFLEFWATWCGPCQQPMNKLNQIAKEHPAAWKDKVRLIALSIDEELGDVQVHIDSRAWLDVNVLIDPRMESQSQTNPGFGSKTASEYSVSGVPTAILIDADGTIVYRGHPSSLDLVTRVEELLENVR